MLVINLLHFSTRLCVCVCVYIYIYYLSIYADSVLNFTGNLSPYLTSYIRKHSSPSDLTYGESVWIYAMAGMGQGMTMYFGGLLERRLGQRLTVLCGAWFQR